MIKNYYLTVLIFCCGLSFGYGQVTIFSENMGTATGTSSIAANVFENNGTQTYTGTADVRNIGVSNGYAGASGVRNVFFTSAAGRFFEISGINTSSYMSLTLSLGHFKSTNASSNELLIEVSSDGTTYSPLSYTRPNGGGTANWTLINPTGVIPSTNNLRIRFTQTSSSPQFRIDDILIEGVLSCSAPADPTGSISGIIPACASTTLTYTGADTTPLLLINYWQTSPTGTDQSNDAVNTYNAPTSGTYYVRKYDVVADCWSTNSVSYSVVIEAATPTISAQPIDQAVIIPATATFSITSSGATSYQWQVSTNGGANWNNVTGGTGANSNTYTTDPTILGMNGNQYRCVATNTCGSTTSNIALLSASNLADVVITEIMYNTAGTDDEWIEICNVSGSPQVLNSYTIEVDSTTEFTFPNSGVVLADGDCITVALGDGGGANFNPDCPFTPDYTNGAGTGTLNNTSDTISLIALDGTSVIDEVTYNSADGGNTDSLHVIDTSLDNSLTSSNYWEVINGGSPGINSLISPCTPVGPEINLEGTTANFPDIANGSTPSLFDGTDFGDLVVGFAIINEFRIENFAGTQNLNITSVTVLSGDTADFSISTLPSSPITPANPNGFSLFDIRFQPTVSGIRSAVIQIISNDADEDPYTFSVTGNGLCAANPITALPATGPVGTVVTVTGTDLAAATASFNGIAATVNNISAMEMEVTVPAGANTGNLEIVDDLGCPGTTPFTVIISENLSCEGSGGIIPTDLFISEITDATSQTLSYIEIYNGTGSAIDIRDYSIAIRFNGNAININDVYDILGNGGGLVNGMLPDGQAYVLRTDVDASGGTNTACTSIIGANGSLADEDTSLNGVNARPSTSTGNGGSDCILLYKDYGTGSEDIIDVWGDCNDASWSRTILDTDLAVDNIHFDSYIYDPGPGNLNINIEGMGVEGFNFKRSSFAGSLPNDTFNKADWVINNWLDAESDSSNQISCIGDNYDDIGLFNLSTGTPPTVNSILSSTTACNESTITVSASEGFGGGNMLEYHWYFYNPAQSGLGWQTIANGGIYTTNVNSPDLIISDAESVLDYQFYCEVKEDDATCYAASDAIKITIDVATWNGAWSSVPNRAKSVILNTSYNTSGVGPGEISFSACNLVLNDVSLNIDNNDFVEVINSLTVNGTNGAINIEPQGAFVQVNDAGSISAFDPDNLTVNKLTAPALTANEYTYWSSPVMGETIGSALLQSNPNRRYSFEAQNFLDSNAESPGNLNVFVAGQDDIDDNADDWQPITLTTTLMQPGVGYASTHDPFLFACTFGPGCPDPRPGVRYVFSGLFNTGEILVPIHRDDAERLDNNWNLIGNPYPSAITINGPNGFLTQNTAIIDGSVTGGAIDGAIFIWSQSSLALDTTIGNENINFSQSDYAIVNGLGGVAAGGDTNGDGTIDIADRPSEFIPSGQSFFISMSDIPLNDGFPTIKTTDVVFNNAMRTTGNNSQFFRNSNNPSIIIEDKLWLNLKTDNGVFNEVLIGYNENATDGDDGMYYDAPRNASTDVNSVIYSLLPNVDKKFAIQGKNSNSLSQDEVISLGFYTKIEEATIYTLSIAQLEGDFMSNSPIYVIDKLNNTIHELTASHYNFNSETGEFNDRFEIVFKADALSVDDNLLDSNELTIIELDNGNVQFKVGKHLNIINVEILDVTGRQIYNLKGNTSTEVYTVSQLGKAAYIAKVTLSNGQVINKKALKRR